MDLDTHEATLTVKMNIPTRQRFCQSNGIQFHTPPTYNFDLWQSENRTNAYNSPNPLVQQFSGVSSVQVDQPPPYHTSNLDQLPKDEEAAAIRNETQNRFRVHDREIHKTHSERLSETF